MMRLQCLVCSPLYVYISSDLVLHYTFLEMEKAMKASNQSVRATFTPTHVFDIKNWISPHLDEIHGHTAPHVFRFRLNQSKKAEMHYKHWSHEEWAPQGGFIPLKVSMSHVSATKQSYKLYLYRVLHQAYLPLWTHAWTKWISHG